VAAAPDAATQARAVAERDHAEAAAARRAGIADALEALTAALRANPKDLALQERWVLVATLAERCGDVMPVYLRIAEESRNPKVHRAGAACAEALEQPREVFLALERFVRTSPRWEVAPDTYRMIAEGFVDLGERGRAKHYFEQFLAFASRSDPHRAAAERFVQDFQRARTDCLVQAGAATAQLVPSGDRWVVQVRIPPNALEQAPTCGE
jgi:tetratricopeptide (TPR) repeat protein